MSGIATSKVDIICHTGDDICLGGSSILAPHLTVSDNAITACSVDTILMRLSQYGTDATAAANFVKSALG